MNVNDVDDCTFVRKILSNYNKSTVLIVIGNPKFDIDRIINRDNLAAFLKLSFLRIFNYKNFPCINTYNQICKRIYINGSIKMKRDKGKKE